MLKITYYAVIVIFTLYLIKRLKSSKHDVIMYLGVKNDILSVQIFYSTAQLQYHNMALFYMQTQSVFLT